MTTKANRSAEIKAPRRRRAPAAKPPQKRPPANGPQSFRAVLEPDHTSLKWVIARIPFDIAEAWTEMHRLRVRGTINGSPFRTSLFPMTGGREGHFLLVNKRMQSAAGVRVGMNADFVLEPDLEERPAELPPDLIAAFDGDKTLLRFTNSLSESMRREIGKWIASVKAQDARRRRSEQMAERLMLAMEGEQVTPPVLEALLVRNPKARAGWNSMTPVQRRSHLLGIFYYQTPEARTRRAEKAVENAIRVASRL